jgi:hypothetical protein
MRHLAALNACVLACFGLRIFAYLLLIFGLDLGKVKHCLECVSMIAQA